jgi:hypothetical protein
MKKQFFCFIFLIFVVFTGFSEEIENISSKENDRNFTIQTNPVFIFFDLLSLGAGGPFFIIDLEGQYKINNFFNLSLTTSFYIGISRRLGDTWYVYYRIYQAYIKPMLIYRPYGTGLEGFYIGFYPFLGGLFNNYNFTEQRYYNSLEFGIGFNTGYKWIFNNGFSLQLGTGIAKSWGNDYRSFSPDGRMLLDFYDLSFDFKIGYSF